MDLKLESEKITKKVEELRADLQIRRQEVLDGMKTKTEELKSASSQGDRSENAEFTEAIEGLQKLRIQLSNIDIQLNAMDSDYDPADYKPIGLIVLYTTFKIRDNKGEEFIFKMCPENVSDLERNILSKNSLLGQAIWLKSVGDTVVLDHKVTGEAIQYTIVDMY